MPITSALTLPRCTEGEMRELDYAVMAHAFAVQRDLGRLCDEKIYQADLAARLTSANLSPIRREAPVTVSFRDFSKTYELDLVVADRAIYELKTVGALTSAHEAQLLNYLLLTNSTRGKLINFRPNSVEARFVNTTLDHAERHRLSVHTDGWQGDDAFFTLVLDLLNDWGTALETSLYREALTHFLGGEERVLLQIPMQREGMALGNQRFHLASADTAFFVTSFTAEICTKHEVHLRRLLATSPLKQAYWVNIGRHDIHFRTLKMAGRFGAGK